MTRAHVKLLFLLTVWISFASELYIVVGEQNSLVQINPESELQLVHVIFRHGDRTPDPEEMSLYPGDPNINNTFYPYGIKALTNTGKEREYKIGLFLREQYKDFLDEIYLPDEIYMRTTAYDRTKMSALACLAGLYPPSQEQQWNPKIMWQPIPYHTITYDDDDMLYYYTCPRFTEARQEHLRSSEFQKILNPYEEFFIEISKHAGRKLNTPVDIFYLDNLFQSEANYDISPPNWATQLMDQIKEMTVIEYRLEFASDEMKRLAGGTLLLKMLEDSYAKMTENIKPKGRKMFIYSAHENNVAALLSCSGVFEPHQPPYAATFILELHKMIKTKEYAFRILYLKDITEPPQVMIIPNCGEFCPYEKFRELTKNTTTNTLKEDCVLKHG